MTDLITHEGSADPVPTYGTHGRVIPLPADQALAKCMGPPRCEVCLTERHRVVAAANGRPNAIDPCRGAAECEPCMRALRASGIALNLFVGLTADRAPLPEQQRMRELLRELGIELWHDLTAAYEASRHVPREASPDCRRLIARIQDTARLIGPAPSGYLMFSVLLTGLYESVHAEIGITVRLTDSMLAVARNYVSGATADKPFGLQWEERDRRIYRRAQGRYVASNIGGWLPGAYATPEAAVMAFDVPREALAALSDEVKGEKRTITTDDLARLTQDVSA